MFNLSIRALSFEGLKIEVCRNIRDGSNALAETINGLYKAELIHRRGPWRTVDEAEYATLE